MQKSSVFEKCNDKWRDLALHLDTSPATKTKIENKLKLDESYGTSDILLDLLNEWRARVHINATLETFNEALKEIDLHDISRTLLKEFGTSQHNTDVGVDPTPVKDDDARPITEEGKKLKEYVQYYIIDLIEMTELSDELLQQMIEKGVLDGKDIENIVGSYLYLRIENNMIDTTNCTFYRIDPDFWRTK